MAYTYTHPIRGIEMVWAPGEAYPSLIQFEYLSDAVNDIWTREHTHYVPNAPTTILQELQQARNAPGGFVNEDGESSAPAGEIVDGLTYDQLREHGYVDPFEIDGYQKWLIRRKFQGTFQQHGSHRVEGGLDRLTLEAGLEVHPSSQRGSSVSLRDWVINAGAVANNPHTSPATMTRRFELVLRIPTYEQIQYEDLHEYGPVAALVVNLNSRRTTPSSMPAITGDEDDDYAFGDPSIYRFKVEGADGNVLFKFTITSTTALQEILPDGTYVTQYNVHGQVIGSGYDLDALRESFAGSETVTGEAEVENPFGSRRTPVSGKRIVLSDAVEMDAIGRAPRITITDDGSEVKHVVPIGYDRVIDYDSLGVVMLNGAEIYREMPMPENRPMVKEIHHYGAENKALRLLNPEQANEYSGTARPITIDNQGAGNLEVQDWDGNNIVTLRTSESAFLRFVYDDNGGSRLLGEVPERYFEATGGFLGIINNNTPGYYTFDTNNYAAMISIPNPQYFDRDAFQRGTDTTHTNLQDWDAATVTTGADTLRMLKAGTLHFEQSLVFEIDGTGNMPNLRTRTYILRAGALILAGDGSYGQIAGNGTKEVIRWVFTRRVERNDVIIPIISYPQGTTLNFGSMIISDFIRTVTLDQDVSIEYERT